MKECILVVDDDPEIVGAIAIALEREGYEVRRAYDGMAALDQCLDPAVKLLMIDVMMPKLDGLSALMRIRERRNLPVIVLSAKSEDSDKILGLSMGADDYVTKPYNPQELVARVRSQLRRYTLLGDEHAGACWSTDGFLTTRPAEFSRRTATKSSSPPRRRAFWTCSSATLDGSSRRRKSTAVSGMRTPIPARTP